MRVNLFSGKPENIFSGYLVYLISGFHDFIISGYLVIRFSSFHEIMISGFHDFGEHTHKTRCIEGEKETAIFYDCRNKRQAPRLRPRSHCSLFPRPVS